MTRFQALLITASFSAPVVVGLFLLVVNYFDNRAAAKQKQADAARQTAGSALALSELSEAEREQLEVLEAFAKAVRNASVAVDESSRRAQTTAAAQRTLESEKQ